MGRIAATLARLHDSGIAHRDIKPANLFELRGDWLLGDFGLIQVPDAESLTEGSQGPGSRHYIAPELIRDPDADGKPADVFSLAKTTWVLAAGQRYPPPGQLRVDVPGLRLSAFNDHRRANMLDALLEPATSYEPEARPTMQLVSADLGDWTEPQTDRAAADFIDRAAQEIAAIVRPHEMLEAEEAARIAYMRSVVIRMVDRVRDLPGFLAQRGLPVRGDFVAGSDPLARFLYPEIERTGYDWLSSAMMPIRGRREPRGRESLLYGMVAVFRIMDRAEFVLAAGYVMPGVAPVVVPWSGHERVIIGSATEQAAVERLTSSLREHVPDAVEAFLLDLRRDD